MSRSIVVQNDVKAPQTGALLPVAQNSRARAGTGFSYEATIQSILADREGRRTWSTLEELEKRAETDPQARRAMFRLETLNAAREYADPAEDSNGPSTVRLAGLLDHCDARTEREGWTRVLAGTGVSKKIPVLKESAKPTGWNMLGYPPCIGKTVGPASRALEQPERWNQMMAEALQKQLQPGEEDPKLKEYRRLYDAHSRVSSGKVRGRISERSLYLDMKNLEEQILPKHLKKARGAARTQLLGDEEHEQYHPQSRVRRFLGALSAQPENSRERHMFQELSRVATRDPQELRRYAAHMLDELKRCDFLSSSLLPDFQKALARVTREQSERRVQDRRLGTSESFQNLLVALEGPKNGNSAEQEGSSIQLYKSGLTVNGTSRDYTY